MDLFYLIENIDRDVPLIKKDSRLGTVIVLLTLHYFKQKYLIDRNKSSTHHKLHM